MSEKQATQIETVTMLDGRVVEFAGKRKVLKSSTLSADGAITVSLDFRNGESRHFTIPQSLLAKFAAHGAEQKLGDECAGLADVDDCVEAVDELMDRLNKGEWGASREASGMAGASILVKALCEAYGKSREQIRTFLADKTQAQKTALRASDKLRPIVERLEAEKASKSKTKVDTDALLAGLDGAGASA